MVQRPFNYVTGNDFDVISLKLLKFYICIYRPDSIIILLHND